MVGEQDDRLKFKNSNFKDDNEIKVAKVEIGNNYALLQMNQRAGMHFSWFSTTTHYIGAWKHSMMNGGTFGMRATCFRGDYGISNQQDQVFKSLLTCCLEMLVLLSPIFT